MIGEVRLGRAEDGRNQIETVVDGGPVTLRSEAELAASADGPVCAFFLPALAAKRPVTSADPIDRTLRRNLDAAAGIAREFWGFEGPMPEAPLTDRIPSGASGQFFTGGVDSLYTLLRNRETVRCLVNVHGFDIKLGDRARYARSRAALSQVAEMLSLRFVSVETDLRAHPLFRSLTWDITHVAALASVAHALAPVVSRVYIGSTDIPPPWGSHPSLDKLWSSGAVEIVHDGGEASRIDKVKALAGWEPARSTLKVCWENLSEELNCGRCEKCVRTQAEFAAIGVGDLPTFPRGDIVERVRAIPFVKPSGRKQWTDIRDEADDRRLRRAVDRLLLRSALLAPGLAALKRLGLKKSHFVRR